MKTWCPTPRAIAAAVVVAYLIAQFSVLDPLRGIPSSPAFGFLRRSLFYVEHRTSPDDERGAEDGGDGSVYDWARFNLPPLSVAPDPSSEVPVFWHIPKSGGSTVKSLCRCFGKAVVVKSRPPDIFNAKRSGEVRSGRIDIIFSSSPDVVIRNLFGPSHKGRALAMFRHPVDRLISKFYYLQIADWEKTYRPEWKDKDILTWARGVNTDNDHMVKRMAGKVQRERATERDLEAAKKTLRARFVVGLMGKMEESVHRFNAVMGVDESDPRISGCMGEFFRGEETRKRNSNPHPTVEEGHPAWRLLAEKNALDMRLYEFVIKLFDEQRGLMDYYAGSAAASRT